MYNLYIYMFKQNVNKTALAGGPCESPAVSKIKYMKDTFFLNLYHKR